MSDFMVLRKGKTVVSGAMHVVFDVALAVVTLLVGVASGTPVIGIVLVLLSKWRMVAVRPRYWLLNVKSNLVDLTVATSLVMLMYAGGQNINTDTLVLGVSGLEVTVAQMFWTVIYMVWLLWLKHQTSEKMTEAQALTAVAVGLTAVGLMLPQVDLAVSVVVGFVIGYGAARHVLVQSEDYDFTMVTFVAGVMLAEVVWALWHWAIILNYGWTQIQIPQVAVVGTLGMFALMKVYKEAVRHDGAIKWGNVWKTVIFSGILMVIVLVWFSSPVKNLVL